MIGNGAARQLAKYLNHSWEATQEGDGRSADGRSTIDGGICHVLDECRQWEDVPGKLQFMIVGAGGHRRHRKCHSLVLGTMYDLLAGPTRSKPSSTYTIVESAPTSDNAKEDGTPEVPEDLNAGEVYQTRQNLAAHSRIEQDLLANLVSRGTWEVPASGTWSMCSTA